MKKHLIKKPMILVSLAFGLILIDSCKKEANYGNLKCPTKAKAGSNEDVIGKWKLLKEQYFLLPRIEDYSCQNIIYQFKSDGTLWITGDSKDPSWKNSNHQYSLSRAGKNNKGAESFILKIDDQEYPCQIKSNMMTYDNRIVDGPLHELARVE